MMYEDSLEYLKYIMDRFHPIGSNEEGGVTRLGYSKEEDLMHWEFMRIAKEEGFQVETDQVGNSYASLGKYDEYHLVGSHLDSVINGGRYDGVIGVAVGLLLLKIVKEKALDIPLKVVAFRCEESSNFMKSTIGSGLIVGENYEKEFDTLVSRSGETLREIFAKRGYSQRPKKIRGVKSFLELHIEQGRILEEEGLTLGIVNAIAGNIRLKVNIEGLAEHSGATPMDLRKDALCCAAEIILGLESLAKSDKESSAVITVGSIYNLPNSVNVIPGKVEFSVDIRDKSNENMQELKRKVKKLVKSISTFRGLDFSIETISNAEAVVLDSDLNKELVKIAENLNIKNKVMPSGAGHDAMKMAKITRTGLIFIPCKEGISHNPRESARLEDAVYGGMVILDYLRSS